MLYTVGVKACQGLPFWKAVFLRRCACIFKWAVNKKSYINVSISMSNNVFIGGLNCCKKMLGFPTKSTY